MSVLYDAFVKFHLENPMVWQKIESMAFALIRRGFKKYSLRTIYCTIRYHHDVGEHKDRTFKLNNNHTPYYARYWRQLHPEYANFFEERKIKE